MTHPKSDSAQTPNISDDGLIHDGMYIDDDSDEDIEWADIDESLLEQSSSTHPNINNSGSNIEDDSWLEALLEGRVDEDIDAKEVDRGNDADLSALLQDVEVETGEADSPISPTVPPVYLASPTKVSANSSYPSSSSLSLASLLWGLGCILLLLLLFAQYVIFNLDNLVKEPSHRSQLQGVCSMLNCALPNADLSQIEISNINHRSHQGQSDRSDIMAAIRNTSSVDQLYPNLKVIVNGASGVAGEFIAEPNDYLITPHRLLGGSQVTLFMFTVPIASSEVTSINIEPIY